MTDDPPSPDERAFAALLADPDAYRAWAADVRAQWERDRGVEWLHLRGPGQPPVWRSTRPPPDPERPATFRFSMERAARNRAKR